MTGWIAPVWMTLSLKNVNDVAAGYHRRPPGGAEDAPTVLLRDQAALKDIMVLEFHLNLLQTQIEIILVGVLAAILDAKVEGPSHGGRGSS